MVRKTKEILVYVVLGILSVISLMLIRFAFVQRGVCLDSGYMEEAEHCLMLGIVCIVLLAVFLAAMAWTWKRCRRAEAAPEKTGKMWSSQRLEDWYARETADIEKIFGKGKVIAMIFSLLMVLSMGQAVFLMMYGMADLGTFLLLLFQLGVIFLMNYMADYQRKYIRPLDRSIRRNLPDVSAQEEFAIQMAGARELAYMPAAGSGKASAWISPDYCYLRQSRTGGIIKTKDMGRVELEKASYTVGVRHVHFRTCYAMAFFYNDTEKKPFMRMYFRTKDELYNAVSEFQRMGLSQSRIQDKTL